MALPALKEALGLLKKLPVLWIPGLVAGLLGAGLWILLFTSGTFFASRLIIISPFDRSPRVPPLIVPDLGMHIVYFPGPA